ncbi:GTP cyclohydrolase-2 [Pseudomonas fluorescens]|nr:GTP cyclohydrolase-2 [Pseudomonas fluorescens]
MHFNDIKKSISCSVHNVVEVPLKDCQLKARFVTFDGLDDAKEHFAIRYVTAGSVNVPLLRVHSECVTGDLFHSLRCDCGEQLAYSMQRLKEEGGILIYLRQEGRGIGLKAKLDAYLLQLEGHDTFEANRLLGHPDDSRDFSLAAKMLLAMGESRVRLLTNNPQKQSALTAGGVEVTAALRLPSFTHAENRKYIAAKRLSGHFLEDN